jgi:MFS family permease
VPGIIALCVGYVLSQFYRSFLAVLVPYLSNELAMTPADLAYASGAWFATFALMQFPVGAWLDRYGPRRTAAFLHAIAGAGGAALFAAAQSPMQVIIAMGLIGIGCAPILMASFYLFARSYSAASFATLGSTFIAVGSLGNIAGSAPMASVVEIFGWRFSLWMLAAMTLATAFVILVVVRDPKAEQPGDSVHAEGYLSLLKIRALWPILPCIFLGYAVAAGIRGLWGGPYLRDVHGLGATGIGHAALAMAIALSLGALFYGPMDRLFNSRKWVVFAGNAVVVAAAALMAVEPQMPVGAATTLFFVIGLFGASYAVQMAHGRAFIPAHMTGRGVTLMNFFSIGGTGVMQFVTGRLVDGLGDAGDWPAAYSALFAFYAIALAMVLAMYLLSRDAKPARQAKSPL